MDLMSLVPGLSLIPLSPIFPLNDAPNADETAISSSTATSSLVCHVLIANQDIPLNNAPSDTMGSSASFRTVKIAIMPLTAPTTSADDASRPGKNVPTGAPLPQVNGRVEHTGWTLQMYGLPTLQQRRQMPHTPPLDNRA